MKHEAEKVLKENIDFDLFSSRVVIDMVIVSMQEYATSQLKSERERIRKEIEEQIEKCEAMILLLQGETAASFYEGRVIGLKSTLSLLSPTSKPTT